MDHMKKIVFSAFALIWATLSPHAQTLSSDELAQRAIERRAIEAMNWGMPAVNYDLMFQAMARAGGAMTRLSIGRNFSTAKTSF
jgi:hypothetical protein